MTSNEKAHAPNVVIVGAGLAGISTAVELKRQLGFENFTIYEKASTLGGTWRDNTYPGCGSDVPGHWYSLSSELNPNWSNIYATQPELQEYWEKIFYKYELGIHTKFNSMVTQSIWSNETQRYSVEVTDTITGEKSVVQANVMFYAIGGFQKPVFSADVPGADIFQGHIWHSARYNHDVELKGKRVGVIGNGCSGAQLIPAIAVDPEVQVVNFCRTPHWIVPRTNWTYPRWLKWMFAHVPLIMRGYRNFLVFRSDITFVIFRKSNSRIGTFLRKQLTKYIITKAPKSEVKNLVPNYPVGCKRIVVDPGYLECLNWPNVKLSYDGIERIVEEGIKLKTGEVIPLDVIIFATGFSVEPSDLHVQGSTGTTIREYHKSKGGPTAYLGCATPGFPNLFILLGPNVISGSTSVIFVQETQIGLSLKLMKPVLDGRLKSVEIKEEVSDKYNDWLQDRLKDSVWTACHSYYHTKGTKESKIIATFPGPVALLYWLMRKAEKWDNWKVVEGEKGWIENEKWKTTRNLALILSSMIVAAGFLYGKS